MIQVSPAEQLLAADPSYSISVTANAGAGKTSTLVNRVARLLLKGSRPEHILCVTYTKAAAAEMQARLFKRLGEWAVESDDALAAQLAAIGEADADLSQARTLFAKALETPGGLKIQTIHAFCEKLLRRFPLEAGLSPNFEVIDDLLGQELKSMARAAVLCLEAKQYPQVALARDQLIVRLKEFNFEKLLAQFINDHDKIAQIFAQLIARHGESWIERLFQDLGLDGVTSCDQILDDLAHGLNWDMIKELADSLSGGKSSRNKNVAEGLREVRLKWLERQYLEFETLWYLFFTKTDDLPRSTRLTNEASDADRIQYDHIFNKIAPIKEQLKAVDIACNTVDMLQLFQAFSLFYTDFKRARGVLDFQDMINKTKALLKDSHMSQWVLFKLDEGLDHILVDEAQDTSQEQWDIINALSDDFFSGLTANERKGRASVRTVFAVGDEKQSIYGFQGAQPERFLEQAQMISLKAKAANLKYAAPGLLTSYRTLPKILNFVDHAFGDPRLTYALLLDEVRSADLLTHAPHRKEAQGLVELWPPVLTIKGQDETVDDQLEAAPVDDNPTLASAQKRLAMQIAAQVKRAISEGHSVYDRHGARPVTAGDVLILVRKRDALFEHIIRELKKADVAVSGADRLNIGDHIAFADVRALMRVCLQPDDHLSLACVLRSPLCSLSEEDVLQLAHDRQMSLWAALNQAEGARFEEAKTLIGWAIEASKTHTVFDFLSRLYNRRDSHGISYKQRFLTRLGQECQDVLNETLGLALKAEGVGAIGVISALDIFEYHATDIKREQEEGGHAVRIMTVHGSKGLEAPWVIMPMGPQNKSSRNESLLMFDEDRAVYLSTGAKFDCGRTASMRQAKAMREDMEALRLYYVALTRARDRLTLCGYWGAKGPPSSDNYPQWYHLSEQAFERLPPKEVVEIMQKASVPFNEDGADECCVKTYGDWPRSLGAATSEHRDTQALPTFITHFAPLVDENIRKWAAISQLGDEDRSQEERAPSPLSQAQGLGRYRRGLIIHKLFEILPEIRMAQRHDIAHKYLSRQSDLDEAMRQEMSQAVFAVLEDDRFAEAFGANSRPEVAVAGKIGTTKAGYDLMLSGRIDRLVVTDDRVLIIDYKSNRPAPDSAAKAPIDYQRQMAGYVALMRQIHPNKKIEAALLWTDGPKLTPFDDALIAERLNEVL